MGFCGRPISFGLLCSAALALTGCSTNFGPAVSSSSQTSIGVIHGVTHGGQQPISGASIEVYAAGTGGYGAASVLLSPNPVLSDTLGNFILTGQYACTPGQQVYVIATGGNPGAGNNSAVGLMAVLGECPTSGTLAQNVPEVIVNEVSTIAAAYSLAPFATSPTQVASSGSTLAVQGIATAFANAARLADTPSGLALAATPAGNGTVPQSEIDTLANILASCINSTGPGSTACSTLLTAATSDGTPSGTAPTDTAIAALNIAHNPGSNITALFGLQTADVVFAPSLAIQPNDFTLGIDYTGGGLSQPSRIAIDGAGDAWVTNLTPSSITELSAINGSALSSAGGFTGGGLNEPIGIALDSAGNAWIANRGNSTVTELSGSGGSAISPATGYIGGGLSEPYGIAVDGAGNVWVTNLAASTVSEFSGSNGAPISSSSGYTGGGLDQPSDIAIDAAGNAWIANDGNSTVTELSGTNGSAISPSAGYTGGGLDVPYGIAIDAAGDVWVADLSSSVSELSGANGSALSPSTGDNGGQSASNGIAIDGQGNVWVANYGDTVAELSGATGAAISPVTGYTGGNLNRPSAIAIDGSGSVWIANAEGNNVTELVGAASPVVTPLAAAVQQNKLGTRP